MGDQVGVYQLFFTSNNRYGSIEFGTYSGDDKINPNEIIIYEDQDQDEINPETLTGAAEFSMKVYKINTQVGELFRFNFARVYGIPNAYIVQKNGAVHSIVALTTAGADNYVIARHNGEMLLVIVNNNFFGWNGGPYARFMKYRLYYTKLSSVDLTLGSTQEITVNPTDGAKLVKFSLNSTASIIFNWTVVGGNFVNPLLDGSIFQLNPLDGLVTISRKVNIADYGDAYIFEPGTYYFVLQAVATSYPVNSIKIKTEVKDATAIGNSELGYSNPTPYKENATPITFTSIPKGGQGAIFNPQIGAFNFNNWINPGINVSLWPEDNPGLFSQQITQDYQLWVWNGFYYVNETFNANNVNLLYNGAAADHPAFIGSTQVFDRVDLKIITPTTDHKVQWYYLSGTTLEALNTTAGFSDGTLEGNKTLGKPGMMRFDPLSLTDWDSVANPNVAGTGFNGSHQAMYWIAIKGSTNTITQVPSIAGYNVADTQVKLYLYVWTDMDVNIDVYGRSGYNNARNALISQQTLNLGMAGTVGGSSSTHIIPGGWLSGEEQARVYITPLNVRQMDWILGDYKQYNGSLTLRVQTQNRNGWYIMASYPEVGGITTRTENINLTSYSQFGYAGYVNKTTHDGIFLSVSSSVTVDWYQFVVNTTNASTCNVKIYFNTPWTSNNYPDDNTKVNFMTTIDAKKDMGIPMAQFWVMITPGGVDGYNFVNFNVARFGIKNIVVSMTLPTLGKAPKGPLPSWVLPVAIGGGAGVAAAVVIGIVIYKKKNPI